MTRALDFLKLVHHLDISFWTSVSNTLTITKSSLHVNFLFRRPGSGNNKKIYKKDPSVNVNSTDTVKFKVFLDLILSGEVDTEHVSCSGEMPR